ncbi:hypothetical protein SAMN05518856_11754 [Paenibacillus sp. OK003]|nr:hypothetical protein SAMN05518856_11754 [Paenibacillus sp. OK003]
MNIYTFKDHINNIEILSQFLLIANEENDENKLFSFFNVLADFI